MNIYINGKFLSQRITGVQRYGLEITRALIAMGASVKVIIPGYLRKEDVDLPAGNILILEGTNNSILWEQIVLPLYLKGKSNFILLSLCNIGALFVKNQAICVHDVAFLKKENWFKWAFRQYYKFMIPKLVKRSKVVITVSEFSRSEISKYLNVAPSKICVAYNAPADQFVNRGLKDKSEETVEGYFLFVGSRDPRKNLHLLMRLFSSEEFLQERLVVVGGASKSFNEMLLMEAPNVVFKNNCSDEELIELYKGAKALINPSFYEGFGLPLIEAMASGCPLIISEIEVFKEIVGENAIYFNPRSLPSLREAMLHFLRQDEKTKQVQVEKNYLRSRDFNWSKSATSLLEFLQSF